jgi:hypothetical protein
MVEPRRLLCREPHHLLEVREHRDLPPPSRRDSLLCRVNHRFRFTRGKSVVRSHLCPLRKPPGNGGFRRSGA